MKKLFINKVTYIVEVNYWENKFTLKVKSEKNDNIKLLQKEAKDLAGDLLKRKSRINFAK